MFNNISQTYTWSCIYTLITKGHVLYISQATITSRWMKVCRALRNDTSLGVLLHRNHVLREGQRLQRTSPGEALARSARRLRLTYETGSSVRCDNTIYDLMSCNISEFGHSLRELSRKMVLEAGARGRSTC